jgi:hypothetical protein
MRVSGAYQSDAKTRSHSKSFAKRHELLGISHEVLWSAMRLRIAFYHHDSMGSITPL